MLLLGCGAGTRTTCRRRWPPDRCALREADVRSLRRPFSKNRIVRNELIADDVALVQEQVYPVAGGRRRNHTGGNEP